MRLQRLLRYPCSFLRGDQLILALMQLALKLRNFRTRLQRMAVIGFNLAAQRLAPVSADVFLLAEAQHVLFHARDFSTQHRQFALTSFFLPREAEHKLMRRRDLFIQLLRRLVRRIARKGQLTGASLFLRDRFPKTRQHLLRILDALSGAITAQDKGGALQHAQLIAQRKVMPGGFARLGERLQLAFQLRNDILYAREIVPHIGKAFFAFLLARSVFDNAGSFFEDAAAVFALL